MIRYWYYFQDEWTNDHVIIFWNFQMKEIHRYHFDEWKAHKDMAIQCAHTAQSELDQMQQPIGLIQYRQLKVDPDVRGWK